MEKIAVRCLLELEAMGISLDVISDPDQVAAEIHTLRTEAGSAFDPDGLILTKANSFWVVAKQLAHPIFAFGVRVDDIGEESVEVYLRRTIQAVFGVRVTGVSHDIFAKREWRRAAYFGGLVGNTAKGISRKGLKALQLATSYAHHCAFVDLGSEVNYGFHRLEHAGRATSYGYNRFDPFVWTTDRSMYEDGNPGWVMQLHRSDLQSLLVHSSRLLSHRLTHDDKNLLPVEIARAASG